MGLQSKLSKTFISRAVWLPSDWQREFDKWVEEISLLLISHVRKNFSDAEFATLNPIQDEARQAKRQNNMLAHRAALRRYGDTAKSLLLAAEARSGSAMAGGDEQGGGQDERRGGKSSEMLNRKPESLEGGKTEAEQRSEIDEV